MQKGRDLRPAFRRIDIDRTSRSLHSPVDLLRSSTDSVGTTDIFRLCRIGVDARAYTGPKYALAGGFVFWSAVAAQQLR